MSYEIDYGRLGCLIEIYAEFLKENSNYIIERNNNLEYFKSILEKIKKNELTDNDLKGFFCKKRLYSIPRGFKSSMRNKWLSNVIEQVKFFNKENQRLDKNKINEISWSSEDNRHYIALTTELLCVFYPDQYCIKNNKVEDMIKKLNELGVLLVKEKKFYEDYDKLIEFEGVILKYMQNNKKLQNVYHKIIGRTNMNYYDVDAFLYWIIDNKYEEKNKLEILREQIEKCLERNSEDRRLIKTLANYFQYKGFYFEQDLITAFYSALKTKGFVILSGLTGTGKTKLAQLFAEIFEIEKIKEKSGEKYLSFPVRVSSYLLLYNKIHIPKRYNEFFNFIDTENGKYVKVVGGNEEENCKIVKTSQNRYTYTLLLRGKVAKWFKDNFKDGDRLQIEIVPTEDNENVILVLKKFEPDKIEIEKKPAYLFLSVRPDWRDSKALLGFYNPITGNYESTNLLKFILEAIDNYNTKKNNADPYFIILDEMNLSHVEYYFADFLSVLESGRDENYWTKEAIKLHNSEEPLLDNNEDEIPKEIKLPPNLYIIGSVNIDETTYMFSPKVLDRAFTIEFREVNLDDYLASLQNGQINISEGELTTLRSALLNDLRNNGKFCAAVADKEEIKNAISELDLTIKDELSKLNQILQLYDLHFGYRVLDEIALFIKYATSSPNEVGKLSPEQALDFAVFMKVLPKFHGPRQKLERPLWLVLNWCLRNSVEYENKTSEELIKGIWKELNGEDKRPNIEDFTRVIQELRLKLNNRRESVSQEANPESQTIDENQNQTIEETPELTSEAKQIEQTSKTEKTPIINKVKYPRTAIKVLTMLRQLYETGFTSFA